VAESEPLLELVDLHTEFRSDEGVVKAVQGVSFSLRAGQVLGLVGESGCGKSATCLSLMRLLPTNIGQITGGEIRFAGIDLSKLSESQMRTIRGRKIAMIFQDPMACLNPYMTIEAQLVEVPIIHLRMSRADARRRAVQLLHDVGIPDASRRIGSYPHELSGGMRQRVMIAMALLCDPQLLIADEPTTALDVTIQAQILELLADLCRDRGLAMILVSHALGIVAGTCDEVAVMYAGRIVEQASTAELFKTPLHPYTAALLRSVPRIERRADGGLETIEGLPPRLDREGFDACTFAPRCTLVRPACLAGEPELRKMSSSRLSRCILSPGELS
jgi:oligopeptide transport system ATP-binding protein